MPNSRQRSVMASPSRSRATKRRRSSTTEHSFQGIGTSRLPLSQAESVTHVSGTICHLCLGSLKMTYQGVSFRRADLRNVSGTGTPPIAFRLTLSTTCACSIGSAGRPIDNPCHEHLHVSELKNHPSHPTAMDTALLVSQVMVCY